MKNLLLVFAIFICNSTFAQISDFKSTDFTIADNVAKLNKGSNLKNLPLLAHKLTSKLPTQVEKFRAIYTWVCNNIESDYYQHDNVSRKRKKYKNDSIGLSKWNTEYKKTAFKSLINKKKTMCTGYAYLIKELCFFANIECEIVDGYGRTASSNVEELNKLNHSWNAVKLNNKWYLCDATWSSGYIETDNSFVSNYNEGYFLTEPTLFAKNHYPINTKWLLNKTLTNSEFLVPPLVYGATFKHKILPVSPKQMDLVITKNDVIKFNFKAIKEDVIAKLTSIKLVGNNNVPYKIYELKNENGNVSFKHQFKHKGFYDVHLKIENDIVATYTIEVLKG